MDMLHRDVAERLLLEWFMAQVPGTHRCVGPDRLARLSFHLEHIEECWALDAMEEPYRVLLDAGWRRPVAEFTLRVHDLPYPCWVWGLLRRCDAGQYMPDRDLRIVLPIFQVDDDDWLEYAWFVDLCDSLAGRLEFGDAHVRFTARGVC